MNQHIHHVYIKKYLCITRKTINNKLKRGGQTRIVSYKTFSRFHPCYFPVEKLSNTKRRYVSQGVQV